MPEWSKGFDSSSNIVRCVGSNPTARIFFSRCNTPRYYEVGSSAQTVVLNKDAGSGRLGVGERSFSQQYFKSFLNHASSPLILRYINDMC